MQTIPRQIIFLMAMDALPVGYIDKMHVESFRCFFTHGIVLIDGPLYFPGIFFFSKGCYPPIRNAQHHYTLSLTSRKCDGLPGERV